MFRRLLNRTFDLDETISIGPYSVVRFGFGRAPSRRLHRMFVFIPIVGLFDNKGHLLQECMAIVRDGGAHFTDYVDDSMVGGVQLEFLVGGNVSYHGLISRAIRELRIHYQHSG